jgi:hypothetical protein
VQPRQLQGAHHTAHACTLLVVDTSAGCDPSFTMVYMHLYLFCWPPRAEVAPMTSFRGTPLTHETAEVCGGFKSLFSHFHFGVLDMLSVGMLNTNLDDSPCLNEMAAVCCRTFSLPGLTPLPVVLGPSPPSSLSHGSWQQEKTRYDTTGNP